MKPFSTKYPVFRVTGESIPNTLATEILIRTTNNMEKETDFLSGTVLEGKFDYLNLQTLNNNLFTRHSESSWLTTNGDFTGDYVRITDKWPTAEDVLQELETIATAFPQLDVLFEFYEEPNESGILYNPINKVSISHGQVTVIPEHVEPVIREAPRDQTTLQEVLNILQIQE